MEDESTALSSPNSKEEEEGENDENILMFLDSLDSYVTLMDSLTSSLRKGWLDLASARHSMGSSRVSSSLLDLKEQSAATTVQVSESIKESHSELHYTLSKWGSSLEGNTYSFEEAVEEVPNPTISQLRRRGSSHLHEGSQETYPASANDASPNAADNNIQKERSKPLAVFGTLVSPKLRTAQVSFESALETIVEIANMRSSMLSAFSRLRKEHAIQIEVPENQLS
ncbi:uncharacterized protein A4U43_C10F18830 [Asparagus officinalis]|uniref:Vacuolar ATPase assembly protein VMA22 n=1 Tax=Asparagus officinalis TaxID=4686 RepID=A0A5P1E775_ASPOF|nr:coiled-coil domain-containing protein 115 isoform X2 [Asparagus officinalis]ONK57317.1 uncharacterized protein A4U43_C10F18830 [Asparagus officinalis]